MLMLTDGLVPSVTGTRRYCTAKPCALSDAYASLGVSTSSGRTDSQLQASKAYMQDR